MSREIGGLTHGNLEIYLSRCVCWEDRLHMIKTIMRIKFLVL